MHKVLIIDDEPDIREIISYKLKKEGYDVATAADGKAGIATIQKFVPDLIILDMMMPGMDGVEVCNHIRNVMKLQNVVICFLSARSEDFSQVAALEAGGDDYITKPITPRILSTKVKSLLRRLNPSEQSLRFEHIVINRDQFLVTKDNEEHVLPKKEFELLALLAEKPNVVFDRQMILDKVWGNDVVVGDRTIDVHVRKLREKLGDDIIKTIKGVGYKFVLK
jgi:two-component system alkaline phosphatase synthesis response regulator PhoP